MSEISAGHHFKYQQQGDHMDELKLQAPEWQVVPTEPTEAMNEAYNAVPCGIGGSPPHSSHVWSAMLAAAPVADVSAAIHYPMCWDTVAYPTVQDALAEIGAFKCSECPPAMPVAPSVSAPTDLSMRLRKASCNPGRTHGDITMFMQAADEIDRYYGGMLAWKKSAEAMSATPAQQAPAAPSDIRNAALEEAAALVISQAAKCQLSGAKAVAVGLQAAAACILAIKSIAGPVAVPSDAPVQQAAPSKSIDSPEFWDMVADCGGTKNLRACAKRLMGHIDAWGASCVAMAAAPAQPVGLSDIDLLMIMEPFDLKEPSDKKIAIAKAVLSKVGLSEQDKLDAARYRFLEEQCRTGSYGGIISRKAIDAAILAAKEAP